MKKPRSQCVQISLLIGGLVLVILGLSIFIYLDALYDIIINDALKVTPTSKAFNAWRINDPPLDLDMYMFNWTNPQEIRNRSVKPKFEEIGPYRFKEVKEKVNIQFHDNNSTISYSHRKYYRFDEKNSKRNLSDRITTINPVPLTVAYQAKNFGFWSKQLLSYTMMSVSSLYVTKTAGELLFDGYEDGILGVLSKVPMLNIKDRFGLFYQKNESIGLDGRYSVSIKNDESFGKLLSWNYKNHTNFYRDHCNDIKGSASEFYPLHRKRDRLVFFSSELCKYAEMDYEKDVIVKGVHGYKYTAENLFDNGTNRPENDCFCVGECMPTGVLNVSNCRENSPSFLSLPHFYGADPYYTQQIEGMKPQKDLHDFYITIEPRSGILMDIKPNMQLNMLLQPINSIRLYHNVPRVLIPIFYFSQDIAVKDELAANLRLIQNLPDYLLYAALSFATLGIAVLTSVCVLWWFSQLAQNQNKDSTIKNAHEELPLNEKL